MQERLIRMKKLLYHLFLEKTQDTKIQFLRYVFVGGTAAVINIGALFVLKECLHLYYLFANVLGFILGLVTNYVLSKLLVFTTENRMNKMIEFLSYAMIGIIGLGFDTLFIWLFTDFVSLYYMISKIISTGLVFIWNFAARKLMYVIFDKKKNGEV